MSSGHVRDRGSTWELRWPLPSGPDGKRRVGTRTISKKEYPSKKQAKALLREIMVKVDRGKHVDPSQVTVAQHLRARIEQWRVSGRSGRRISDRTAEHYLERAAQIEPYLGHVKLQKLTTLHVEEWHAAMLKRGIGRSLSSAHALLARALDDAKKHKLIVDNVAREQGPPGRANQIKTAITPNIERAQQLLAALKDDPWYVPVLVALYTGLRRGEQLALRWENVDLDGAKLHVTEALEETKANGVVVKTPKTSAGKRTITLPSILVETLRAYRTQQMERNLFLGLGRPTLVFPNDDGDFQSPRNWSMRWRRKVRKIGMRGITWHQLRHAHASALIGAGVPVTVVAARLGHADPAVTLQVYAHLFAKDDAEAAQALESLIG